VIGVQGASIWDALHHPWTRYPLRNGFALDAFHKPRIP